MRYVRHSAARERRTKIDDSLIFVVFLSYLPMLTSSDDSTVGFRNETSSKSGINENRVFIFGILISGTKNNIVK